MDPKVRASNGIKKVKVCDICGHPGSVNEIATCYRCKRASEHIYCMRAELGNAEVWCCEECSASSENSHVKQITAQTSQADAEKYRTPVTRDIGRINDVALCHNMSFRIPRDGKVKYLHIEENVSQPSGAKGKASGSRKGLGMLSARPHRAKVKNSVTVKSPCQPKRGASNIHVQVPPSSLTIANAVNGRGDRRKREVSGNTSEEKKRAACAFKEEAHPSLMKNMPIEGGSSSRAYDSHSNKAEHRETTSSANAFNASAGSNAQKIGRASACLIVSNNSLSNSPVAEAQWKYPGGHQPDEVPSQPQDVCFTIFSPTPVDVMERHWVMPTRTSTQSHNSICVPSKKNLHVLMKSSLISRGEFEIFDVVSQVFAGLQAHIPGKLCHKAYDMLKMLPKKLKFRIHRREDIWPKVFQLDPPCREDIALYIFPNEHKRYKDKFMNLLERIYRTDKAMRSLLDDDVELLVFTSKQLVADHQITGSASAMFMWGVFRHLNRKIYSIQHQADQKHAAGSTWCHQPRRRVETNSKAKAVKGSNR